MLLEKVNMFSVNLSYYYSEYYSIHIQAVHIYSIPAMRT